MWHAWRYLVSLSFWRQGRSLQTLTALLLIFLLAGIVLVISTFNASIGRPGWNVGNFSRELIVGNNNLPGVYFNLLVPLICLCFGTQALGGEWEERSLVWTLTRPLPRPLIYLGKFVAALPWTLAFTLGGFFLAGLAVGPRHIDFNWNISIAEHFLLWDQSAAHYCFLNCSMLTPYTLKRCGREWKFLPNCGPVSLSVVSLICRCLCSSVHISSLNRAGNGVCFLVRRIDRHHARSAQAYESCVLFPLHGL